MDLSDTPATESADFRPGVDDRVGSGRRAALLASDEVANTSILSPSDSTKRSRSSVSTAM
jgi:hypothetical protein